MKIIEYQGAKQIKAIKDQGYVKELKKYDYNTEDSPLILKQKEIFNQLVEKKRDAITEVDKKFNRYYLICRYKGKSPD